MGNVSCNTVSWGFALLENPKVKSTVESGPGLVSLMSYLGFCSICSGLGASVLLEIKAFGQVGGISRDVKKWCVLEVGRKRRQLE